MHVILNPKLLSFQNSPSAKKNKMKKFGCLLSLIVLVSLQACRQYQSPVSKMNQEQAAGAETFEKAFHTAREMPKFKSLLVSQNNIIVAEEYFQDYSADSLDHLRSATKSIMATLIGIAIDKGVIGSVDESIAKYLGEKASGKEAITIKHLMTMTSGLAWDEGLGYNDNNEMIDSGNPTAYVLNKPIVAPPGTVWNYSTGSIHLLSSILTKASGMNTLEFANKYLFRPIGIQKVQLQKFGDGYYSGGSRLEMKPRDMIKIGQLYANGGMINGNRILSEQFIKEATSLHNPIGSFTEQEAGFGYGYAWWIGNPEGIKGYMASGYAGQTIIVIPAFQLVIAMTQEWLVNGQTAIKQQERAQKIAGLVLEVILDKKGE